MMKNKFKGLFSNNKDVTKSFERFLTHKNAITSLINFFLNISYSFSMRFKRKLLHDKKNTKFIKLCGLDGYNPINYLPDIFTYYQPSNPTLLPNLARDTTVIIPVYNGYDHLTKLFSTLFLNTDKNTKLIIIDDASTDTKIKLLLEKVKAKNKNVEVIFNKTNYGFTKTINIAMSNVKTKFAVWLNSDTAVPSNWLNKLIYPLVHNNFKIATTTPFTNSGCFYSFPIFGKNNDPYNDIEEINEAFNHIYPLDVQRNLVHSGTGFCMGINMKAWRETGELDFKNFGKGYGEENDFCFRALKKGWQHVIVPNLYVQHFHGGSFNSREKSTLTEEHQKILIKKHPEIMSSIVPLTSASNKWKIYRQVALLSLSTNVKRKTLVIDLDSKNNGANDFSLDAFSSSKTNSYIFVRYEPMTNNWNVCFDAKIDYEQTNIIPLKSFTDLKLLFEHFQISTVIINNLAFNSAPLLILQTLIDFKNIYKFKVEYLFHDYLSICPSLFLLTGECKPCQIKTDKECNECLLDNNYAPIKCQDIKVWREAFSSFLSNCEKLTFFSNYTYGIVTSIYKIDKNRCHIVPHKSIIRPDCSKYVHSFNDSDLTIAFVGLFSKSKGGDYFIRLKKIFRDKKIKAKFIIIGNISDEYKNIKIKSTGRYERDHLGKILTDYNVDIAIFPSVSNETFSYTVQELMMLSVPLVVFPCGAPKERILKTKYDKAEIAKSVDDESLFEATIRLIQKLKK